MCGTVYGGSYPGNINCDAMRRIADGLTDPLRRRLPDVDPTKHTSLGSSTHSKASCADQLQGQLTLYLRYGNRMLLSHYHEAGL